ncbi:GNAT family N-acetyltransferase [Geomicrobium sp. JSM 1781026]|uniref:GNAT family N-acetyltransferase n=1 Tax=Geomicrobium sp. JSM 1781026 TaxID=3344580 RepID=UPI0035C0DC08
MVTLVRMNSEDVERYVETAIRKYARENVKSGTWKEEGAEERARATYERLLPHLDKTTGHFLYDVYDEQTPLGLVWFAKVSDDEGFIYDISLSPEHQGKGWGKQTMQEVERLATKMGISRLGLQVFGHNDVARRLYEKLDYEETNIIMKKDIRRSRA